MDSKFIQPYWKNVIREQCKTRDDVHIIKREKVREMEEWRGIL